MSTLEKLQWLVERCSNMLELKAFKAAKGIGYRLTIWNSNNQGIRMFWGDSIDLAVSKAYDHLNKS